MLVAGAPLLEVAAWVSPKEAAAAVRVSDFTMWRWIRAGRCISKRTPGGRYLVAVDHDGHPIRRDP